MAENNEVLETPKSDDAPCTQTPQPNPTVQQNPAPNFSTDISHPFQITQHKLTGLNFQECYQSIILVIKGKGKMGYLSEDISAPVSKDPNYRI